MSSRWPVRTEGVSLGVLKDLVDVGKSDHFNKTRYFLPDCRVLRILRVKSSIFFSLRLMTTSNDNQFGHESVSCRETDGEYMIPTSQIRDGGGDLRLFQRAIARSVCCLLRVALEVI